MSKIEWMPREMICRQFHIERLELNKLIERADSGFLTGTYRHYGDSNVLMFRRSQVTKYFEQYAKTQEKQTIMLQKFIKPNRRIHDFIRTARQCVSR